MNILVVEDEPKIGEYLKKGLTESGYIVTLAANGIDGRFYALSHEFDLIILDIMLPGINGWQLLDEIRRVNIQVPVMFLTAKDGVGDRVKGLESGADDYLSKPFAFTELLARIKNLLRRSKDNHIEEVISVSDLTINIKSRIVKRSGKKLHLTPKEYLLLELLARRQGEVLPRSLIASLVWDMNFDSDTNVIDVAIRRLRAKVDDDYQIKLIHTIRGMGYKLEGICDDA
ncbi:heavy metal response regulator transcription factor [Aeromonas veronii]|jgi:two-component system, OmpR family, copper resistance phosphate regulon response regulator CusR|uniref:DNA-binding response regulator n=1 Tax=Aeromonas hydrophila TaxID=644 RepID=A0ABD7G5R9_AERHY|nr:MULTISPECIES: heavy metal response regulator transcription factor [Aeromonas]EKP0304737.1 heavy metal response regulator transcription factor [Aeromonas veronii]EKP0310065.1 heavy metal response regulator transcription factor [Aeromonas veronii]MBC8672618.1 heavy metal response regulator transcription factor [Aeromonas hydrophila]MBC8688500.1 heavy metal response regulator transcription factor [Aeromonas hydrophila]MBO0400366.1 heavy metal response regulator transcription factor [Aeromonas 